MKRILASFILAVLWLRGIANKEKTDMNTKRLEKWERYGMSYINNQWKEERFWKGECIREGCGPAGYMEQPGISLFLSDCCSCFITEIDYTISSTLEFNPGFIIWLCSPSFIGCDVQWSEQRCFGNICYCKAELQDQDGIFTAECEELEGRTCCRRAISSARSCKQLCLTMHP